MLAERLIHLPGKLAGVSKRRCSSSSLTRLVHLPGKLAGVGNRNWLGNGRNSNKSRKEHNHDQPSRPLGHGDRCRAIPATQCVLAAAADDARACQPDQSGAFPAQSRRTSRGGGSALCLADVPCRAGNRRRKRPSQAGYWSGRGGHAGRRRRAAGGTGSGVSCRAGSGCRDDRETRRDCRTRQRPPRPARSWRGLQRTHEPPLKGVGLGLPGPVARASAVRVGRHQ